MIYSMSHIWYLLIPRDVYIPYARYSDDNYYNDQREYHRMLFRMAEHYAPK